MATLQNETVCIKVEFRNRIEYCDIRLDGLSRQTLLEDGRNWTQIRFVRIQNIWGFLHIPVSSVVPKFPKSESINLTIYDETNAVIPINLLGKVITTYMHRRTFRLRIAFGIGLVQSVDDSKITSVIYTSGRLTRIN